MARVLDRAPCIRRQSTSRQSGPPPATPLAPREELNQPVFAAIDAFEYPELHDESIATRNFLRHLGKLMANTGVKDFTMKVGARTLLGHLASTEGQPRNMGLLPPSAQDIYKPEPLRLRRHLSAIINFAKFRQVHGLARGCPQKLLPRCSAPLPSLCCSGAV